MVLPESFVADVIEHMNADHPDSLRDYAMAYGKLDSVRNVSLTALSEKALTLECNLGQTRQMLTIPLIAEIKRPEQMRGVLVAMAKEARVLLGKQQSD